MFHFDQNGFLKPYSLEDKELDQLKHFTTEADAEENFAKILERLRMTPHNILTKLSSQAIDNELLNLVTQPLKYLSENAKKNFEDIIYFLIKFSSPDVLNIEVDDALCSHLLEKKQSKILQLILRKLPTQKAVYILQLAQGYFGLGATLWESLIQFSQEDPKPLYIACAHLKKQYPDQFDLWNETLLNFFEGNSPFEIKLRCEIILLSGYLKVRVYPYESTSRNLFYVALILKRFSAKKQLAPLDHEQITILINRPKAFFDLLDLDRSAQDLYISIFSNQQLKALITNAYTQQCRPFLRWLDSREPKDPISRVMNGFLFEIINHENFLKDLLQEGGQDQVGKLIQNLTWEGDHEVLQQVFPKLGMENNSPLPSAPAFEENPEQTPPPYNAPPATTVSLVEQNAALQAELLAVKAELNELKQRQKETAGKRPAQSSNEVDQHEITRELLMGLQNQVTILAKTLSSVLIKSPTAVNEVYRPSSPSQDRSRSPTKIGCSAEHGK